MVKVGCKYLNPSKGAREQLVTNLRSIHRSFGSNPEITWDIKQHKLDTNEVSPQEACMAYIHILM